MSIIGRARALGRALLNKWGGGGKKTYTAKGWHAQITKLTESPRGYDAMEKAGIDVKPDALINWLAHGGSEDFSPKPSNVAKIREAYERMAGRYWDPANEDIEYQISGQIDSGDRVQDRVLVIDGGEGNWAPIRAKYESGEMDEKDAEDLFIEHVIVEDIDESSEGTWAFPGGSYTV